MGMHWKSISFSPCLRMQVLYLPLQLISYYLHNHNDKLKDSEIDPRQIWLWEMVQMQIFMYLCIYVCIYLSVYLSIVSSFCFLLCVVCLLQVKLNRDVVHCGWGVCFIRHIIGFIIVLLQRTEQTCHSSARNDCPRTHTEPSVPILQYLKWK